MASSACARSARWGGRSVDHRLDSVTRTPARVWPCSARPSDVEHPARWVYESQVEFFVGRYPLSAAPLRRPQTEVVSIVCDAALTLSSMTTSSERGELTQAAVTRTDKDGQAGFGRPRGCSEVARGGPGEAGVPST